MFNSKQYSESDICPECLQDPCCCGKHIAEADLSKIDTPTLRHIAALHRRNADKDAKAKEAAEAGEAELKRREVKEEIELDEAKLPVQHAVNAVRKVLGTKSAVNFIMHLKPGTEKHTTWDKVNSALMKQSVKQKHIADIAMHVRPAQYKEEVELDEAKGALTYKPEHAKWGVVPKSRKEFVKFFPKDKEADARAHAEKTGGTLKKIDQAGRAMKEEVEIEEAVKLGSKVKIHAPGKDYHEKVGHVGEIRHGAYKGAPKTYTVDYDHNPKTGYSKSVQLDKKHVKLHTEDVELDEAQTPYYKKQGWIKKMSQVAKQERLAREKKEKDAQQKSVKEGTELDESLKTHYQNGYDAQKKGKTRQDNPHREGSPAASMWAKGWEHASDKREPQKFANEEVSEQKSPLPPHLQKLIKDKQLDKKPMTMVTPSQKEKLKATVKDATPKGYGPNEEVDLDEAVEISHDRYIRSHGKKASGGHGEWLFTHKRSGDVDYKNEKEVHRARGTFSDAQKSAKKWAKQHGHSTAYVMEDTHLTNIKETSMKTFAEFKEELSGNQHKLDKNKNGKLDKQDFKMLRKEEEELDEISKYTLGSYVKKAADDVGARAYIAGGGTGADDSQKKRNYAKAVSRLNAIPKAVKRLSKEEYELEEELKGDMHPDASKVLKHIKPEHHSVYKPYLKKGTYNGSYSDRSAVLKAAEKAGHTVSEEVDLEEGWDDMKKAVAARMAAGNVRDKSKFDKKEYKTGTVYTRKSSTFSDEDDAASDKKAEKQAQAASGEAPVKRGRGRPKGSYGSYKARSAETAARAAAKSAASKAANKAMKKESFDAKFVEELFSELTEQQDIIDFIDLLRCEEFDQLDDNSKSALTAYINKVIA